MFALLGMDGEDSCSDYAYDMTFIAFLFSYVVSVIGCIFESLISYTVSLIGAFAKLRKASISCVMSVRSLGTTRLPLDGFSWN